MRIFAIDQLIVLQGGHSSESDEGKGQVSEDDKMWNKGGGEKADKEKQSNYQLGLT